MTTSVIISPVTTDGQVPVVDKGFLYSYSNTISTNTALVSNKNYYADGGIVINDLVTLTIPNNTNLIIE